MKYFMKIAVMSLSVSMLLALNRCATTTPQSVSSQEASVSFQVFYDELAPYGRWIQHPDYGYIWIPNSDPEFNPYESNGHWVLTDVGWAWVSGYPWGWAPFHYGRWDYNPVYGWLWVPGNEWAPAWVVWRHSEGYYGWAPIRPNISINIALGENYDVPAERWVFVHDRDINRGDIHRAHINRSENITIIKTTKVINRTRVDNRSNVTYIAGPAREEVEKVVARQITPVQIRENNKPGENLNGEHLEIYRPRMERNRENAAPSRVERFDERKPSVEPKAELRESERDNNPRNNQPHRERNNARSVSGRDTLPPVDDSTKPVEKKFSPVENKKRESLRRTFTPPDSGLNNQPRRGEKNIPPNTKKPEQNPRKITPPDSTIYNRKDTGLRQLQPPENKRKQQKPKELPPDSGIKKDQPARTEDTLVKRRLDHYPWNINENDTDYRKMPKPEIQQKKRTNENGKERQSIQRKKSENNRQLRSGKKDSIQQHPINNL